MTCDVIWYIYMYCNIQIYLSRLFVSVTTYLFALGCLLIKSWQVAINLRTSVTQKRSTSPPTGPFFNKRFIYLYRLFVCGYMCLIALIISDTIWCLVIVGSGGRFKNTYELLNLRARTSSTVNKIYIFQCLGKIFCVEFQRYPLKFHTKYYTHTLEQMIFIQHWNFKSS